MPLSDGDFLKWYNDEITRYRNMEWKTAGYSVLFSYITVFISKHPETKDVFEHTSLAMLVAVVVIGLFLVELYQHKRLNDFRAQRDALRIGNASHLNARGRLFLGSVIDTAYMTTFLLVPVLLGLMAFLVLWQNP